MFLHQELRFLQSANGTAFSLHSFQTANTLPYGSPYAVLYVKRKGSEERIAQGFEHLSSKEW